VRASWEAIFSNTGEMRFTLGEVQVAVRGPLAWVTCTENILSEVRSRVSVTSVLATNIFEQGDDGWLMVHHHASHVLSGSPEA
jgi:ketosteroid isomerase-like protein